MKAKPITISDIIKLAGGAARIAAASERKLKRDAVYKWPQIGIPDRHWPTVIKLTGLDPQTIYDANVIARTSQERAA